MNVFRKIAQLKDRDDRLVAAKTAYYGSLNELRYRQSRSGRKLHDASSISQQRNAALQIHEEIRQEFGVVLDLPES